MQDLSLKIVIYLIDPICGSGGFIVRFISIHTTKINAESYQ